MNILMLTIDYPPPVQGGLPRQVASLAQCLAREHTVGVVTMGCDRMDGNVRVFGAESFARLLPKADLPPLGRTNLALGAMISCAQRERHWDLLHAHDWMVAPSALSGRFALQTPLLTSVHANAGGDLSSPPRHRQRRLEWEAALGRASSTIIACSRYLRDALADRYPAANVTVIPNALQHEWTSDLAGIERKHTRLLFVGRLVPYKGCQDLLHAVRILVPHWPRLDVHVVGDGFGRTALESLQVQLGLQANVSFLGWKDGDVLKREYQEATVVVVPSHEEAFGLVALEALASGAALVASDVGGLPEVVHDGITGLLTPAGQPEALARQIDRLLANPDQRAALGRRGRIAAKHYRWDRVVMQYYRAYENALEHSTVRHDDHHR